MVSKPKHIHFIGIGGVGMSGIALVANARGVRVSGSDMKESRATKKLVSEGIEVMIGQTASNLADDLDAVVISSAISEKNPELAEARKRGIPVWHRSNALASLGEGRKTLACAGTHGKTTTSSMLATMVDRMGLDPSFVIGGTVDGYDTNAKNGTGDFYIVEADESDGSFVHLSPYVALVTNIEPDHLDHYGSLDRIYAAFEDFLSLLPDEGAAVVCGDNPRLAETAEKAGKRTIVYGEKGTPGCDVCFEIKERRGIGYGFDVSFPDGLIIETEITRNPGRHNVLNATGVLAVAWACGLDVEEAARALSTFSGVRRRFDLVGEAGGVTVVDDYAHHPTEIKATIDAASNLDFKHVHVLFQPHRYSRTQSLADEFGEAFEGADSITVMDVYPAGETPIPGISGKTVIDSILLHNARQQVAWLPHRPEVSSFLLRKLQPGDLIITMGAGDVTMMAPLLVKVLAGE